MREKEVYTRARREKIRICAIVPLSAMISSSSSESTSIVAVICDESSNRCKSPIRLSLLCGEFFLFVHFLFRVFRVSKFVWEFFSFSFIQLFCR